ncbi:CHASE2 domain-containing protein [Rhizobium sp. RAF56]|uniref:CHASE2 domain-containing protein n=1 Tax=Rhizobium sp. RAF56 TaxID=3233062 RepID=UPI003F94D02C
MRRPSRQTLIAVMLAAAWGAALGVMHLSGRFPAIDGAEATLANFRTVLRGPRRPPDIVTIVAIDDATVDEAGGYPLPRAALASIVDTVAKLRPKALALDLLLVDRGPEAGDQALADALRLGRSVIAAAAVFPESLQELSAAGGDPMSSLPNARELLLPQRRFTDVAAIGVVNVETDKAGTPRFAPMLFRSGARLEPSFPLSVAAAATAAEPGIEPGAVVIGGRRIPTDIGYLLPLSFYGPRGSISVVSAAGALKGNLPADRIKDHVVVIGATVTGGGDVFPTPFDPVLPGVEVIATAITHLMAGDGLMRNTTTRWIDLAFAVALPAILVGLLAWRRSVAGLVAVFAVIAVWLAVNVVAFTHGVWLSAALPIAAAAPPALLFGAAQLLLGRRRATHFERQSELLQRIEAPGLSEFLARDPDFLAIPVRQDAAVVFIDLNGFTGLSETIGPAAVRELLSGFYELVDEEVTAHGGAITSFMGDGAMLLFGLPQPSAGDSDNAIRCCLKLTTRMRSWRETLPSVTAARIGFKIGAHFGTVVASRLGEGSHQQISATGDTVNVASRLMEVAARHKADVAVSDELLRAAGHGSEVHERGQLRGPVETRLRGREGSMLVWLWRA